MTFSRLLFIFLFFVTLSVFGQTKDTVIVVEKKIIVEVPATVSKWQHKNSIGFDLSEITFVNWNAGGVSSISGLAKGQFSRIYTDGNLKWGNELITRYGLNKQDGVELRKTDDVLQFTSTVGYRHDTISNWYHSAKFSFNTQFTNGYNYPNTDVPISKFMAPGYTFFGLGAEYSNKEERINIYLSPLTMKNTFVLDQDLADKGSFGVKPAMYDLLTGERVRKGEMTRTELGFLFTSHIKREIFKNIQLENRLNLYTDYLKNFGNIDVDWQLQLEMTVNQYVKVNIGLHMIYDDDVKAKKEVDGEQVQIGPRIQLKQMLGIGLVYNF